MQLVNKEYVYVICFHHVKNLMSLYILDNHRLQLNVQIQDMTQECMFLVVLVQDINKNVVRVLLQKNLLFWLCLYRYHQNRFITRQILHILNCFMGNTLFFLFFLLFFGKHTRDTCMW